MKKMIGFGAVALCAAVACADVNSANVVGYQNLNMLAGGAQSMCFTFSNVGATQKKLMLTDIKVVGYQDSPYWKDQMTCPNIYLKKLNSLGAAEATYAWRDNFDDEVGGAWLGGRWRIYGGPDLTPETDVELNAGDGFFVEADNLQEGCTAYSFLVNGEVIQGSYAAEMLAGGASVIGNMMPTSTKLTKVEVQGYQDSPYWKDQMTCPNIYLKKLNSLGAAEATYAWRDNFDDEVGGAWLGGRWRIYGGPDLTPETDVTLMPGDAFFVEADNLQEGCDAYTLVFPACLEITK